MRVKTRIMLMGAGLATGLLGASGLAVGQAAQAQAAPLRAQQAPQATRPVALPVLRTSVLVGEIKHDDLGRLQLELRSGQGPIVALPALQGQDKLFVALVPGTRVSGLGGRPLALVDGQLVRFSAQLLPPAAWLRNDEGTALPRVRTNRLTVLAQVAPDQGDTQTTLER